MSNTTDELAAYIISEVDNEGPSDKLTRRIAALIHRTQLESQIAVLESIKQATRQAYDNRALISIESMNDTMAVHTNAVVENALLRLQAALEKQA